MNEKILFVDDEANILDTFRRGLHRRFTLETAPGGKEGLDCLQSSGPFAVVVSDLKMPKMDGIQFLRHVREMSPNTVRVMLTGHADLEAAIAAVNEGHVFRFLTKPCDGGTLIKTLEAALEQYRLITAEKELLHGTLRGSIKVLVEILSLVNPEAFGRSERIKRMVVATAKELRLKNIWRLELAAMLSQIGCVSIPEEILSKKYSGQPLGPEEEQIYGMHASIAVKLLDNIPRMDEINDIIAHQADNYVVGLEQPIGARILKLALDFDDLEQQGMTREKAISVMRDHPESYDPGIQTAFERAVFVEEGFVPRRLPVRELLPGMILGADVKTVSGILLLAKGQELTDLVLERLIRLSGTYEVREPVLALAPIQ
ncbi:response regulator [Desulfovibrio sulfodismutans]|uniref:Response regulator n=1 Tax=Desulfolutivibrio sulfodismutans TaxID=63561 RepID=A0A7K3NIP9_9BACT|nr:HD domain-containing phosphohydrolase [Desulfolutivibrio sulfodismutans]NDY56081.1 response regulator [Desulfolutivibrio sulfodismutans]